MKTIKDILSAAKVNEDGKLSEEVIEQLEDVIAEMVADRVQDQAKQIAEQAQDPIMNKHKEQLIKEHEELFEQYKTNITEQFSDFCDSVFDKELEIPENIKKWAYLGERYADLIETIRARVAVDEGQVDDQMKETLKEAAEEISNLRSQVNEHLAEKVYDKTDEYKQTLKEASDEIRNLRKELFVHENYAYLPKHQRNQMISLIPEGTRQEDLSDEVRLAYKQIVREEKDPGAVKTPVQQELEKKCKCPTCGKTIDVANNISCSMIKCPECASVSMEECDCEGCDPKVTEAAKQEKQQQQLNESFTNNAAKFFAQLID